jgi:hypothetical protein
MLTQTQKGQPENVGAGQFLSQAFMIDRTDRGLYSPHCCRQDPRAGPAPPLQLTAALKTNARDCTADACSTPECAQSVTRLAGGSGISEASGLRRPPPPSPQPFLSFSFFANSDGCSRTAGQPSER